METRRKTRPGVLTWTPAPVQSSPTENPWEHQDVFFSQMDENGVIGLSEALEEVELEETRKPPEPASPEEPSRSMKETPTEELRERRLHPQSSGRDQRAPLSPWFKTLMEDEMLRQKTDKQRTRNHPDVEEGERGAAAGLTRRVDVLDVGPDEISAYPGLGFQPAPHITASFLPHLFHLTAEELAAAPDIEAETLPDVSESPPESRCSPTSMKSSPESSLGAFPQPAASSTELFSSNLYSVFSNDPEPSEKHDKPHPSPEKAETSRTRFLTRVKTHPFESKQQRKSSKIPRRVTEDAAQVDEFRSLSHQTPDFSKVEPRVHFPKSGYKPPKSKRSPTGTSLPPEPPMAFKSPADIVKEVLLKTLDGYSSSGSSSTPTNAAKFTVPPDFRCRHQASTLLQQLQEDYNNLLTKYAEAENTIDRLRLEARVNLNSDPPKAKLSVSSGLNLKASEFLMLDFSQAQRAELSSDACSAQLEKLDACPSNPPLGRQPATALLGQTETLLQQLQSFEDLLKSENLSVLQKKERLAQLCENLASLERRYLLIRDEHKLLLQGGAETCSFDPQRELEGLIFQCGLHLEELKEQICDRSPSSEEEKTLTHAQSSPEPLLAGPGDAAGVEMGDEEEEDVLRVPYQRPQICKRTCLHPDSTPAVDPNQISEERPRQPPPCSALNTGSEEEEQKSHRAGNGEGLARRLESDQDSRVGSRRHGCSRSSPSSGTPALPVRSRRRLVMSRSPSSSLSSLPDTAPEKRSFKAPTGTRRVLSQDGVISPETDSGFVGSDSSRLAPAVAPIVLHQGVAESASVPQGVNSRGSQPASPSSSSLSHTAQESTGDSQLDPNQPRRTQQGQRRRAFSLSSHVCVSHRHQSRAGSRTGESWIQTLSGSESGQSDQHSGSVDSAPYSAHSDSPPAACCLHGDSLRALGSLHKDALVTHQAEVDKPKKRESFLRSVTPPSSAAPSARRSRSRHIRSDSNSLGRVETHEVEGNAAFRWMTSASAQKPQQDVYLEPSTSTPGVSRCTQTTAESHSRKTQTGQHSSDQRASSPLSVLAPPGGDRSSAVRCWRCGGLKPQKCSETDRHTQKPSSHHNVQPAPSPDRTTDRRLCAAASAPILHLLPVGPPQLLAVSFSILRLCSAALHSSPDNVAHVRSRVRRPREEEEEEERGRVRRSLSVDRSVDSSLARAVRAARHMKHTSRHMARSLASGLQHHQLLAQAHWS
nr:microtubule organization protein AKNA isoform X2 [Nothobranchius furzeri]